MVNARDCKSLRYQFESDRPLQSSRYSSMVERMSVEHDTVVRFYLSGPHFVHSFVHIDASRTDE